MKIIGAVLALFGLADFADAQCRTFPLRSHDYYQPVYRHYEAVYQPYSLSIGYQPDSTELLGKLFEAYKAKSEEHAALLERMALSGGTLPLKLEKEHPGLSIARTDCASCHSAEDRGAKGGKHVFFTAGKLTATDEQVGEMIAAVEDGRMPKGRKWADKEKSQFLFWIVRSEPTVREKK